MSKQNSLYPAQTNGLTTVENKDVRVDGCFLKIAKLNDEYYVSVDNPTAFVGILADAGVNADLFTFVQELHDRKPKYGYRYTMDAMAVLPLTTYDNWMNKQITFKPRNKIRKALKNGVETRVVEFSDDLIRGIQEIYNETPIRQGRRNVHYGKDYKTLKREHATFLDRSEFIGAYFKNALIGFVKVTHSKNYSIIMNIVSKVANRDKAPTNALIAKTVELVTSRNIPLLGYGIWGRRGLNDFKTANGFERFEVTRYFVPLTLKGKMALKLGLYRGLKERLPECWLVWAADMRAKWNERKHGNLSLPQGDAISASGPLEKET